MSTLARKKSLLKSIKKPKTETETVPAEPKSRSEIKQKLSALREQSAQIKKDLDVEEDVEAFDDSEIVEAPKKTFALYTPTNTDEAEEMLSKMEGEEEEEEKPGNRVITISRLPHGFYEKELQQFFEQIAPVTGVRVLRNKKTGKSRGSAFVQFTDADIAKMVAEEMDYYYLMDKVVRVRMCRVPLKHHARIFQDKFDDLQLLEKTNHRAKSQYYLIADYLRRRNEPKTKVHIDKIMKGKKTKLQGKKNKWTAKGIDYDFKVGK
jgi:nucleolar protein 15